MLHMRFLEQLKYRPIKKNKKSYYIKKVKKQLTLTQEELMEYVFKCYKNDYALIIKDCQYLLDNLHGKHVEYTCRQTALLMTIQGNKIAPNSVHMAEKTALKKLKQNFKL